MSFLKADAHDSIFCPETTQLGEILWHLLKGEQVMRAKCERRFKEGRFVRAELTEFGEEVGRDEIHWWVFKQEDDLDALRARTERALAAADRLKAASTKLKDHRQESYEGLLKNLRQFAEGHVAEIREILDYITWLQERNVLAPSILFTYRVWGSTRRGDRWLDVDGDVPLAVEI